MEDVGIFMDIWLILRTFYLFYVHLVYFVLVWYKFPCVGILYQEKSGDPAVDALAPIKTSLPEHIQQRLFCLYLFIHVIAVS
jgi:hypothetical protein